MNGGNKYAPNYSSWNDYAGTNIESPSVPSEYKAQGSKYGIKSTMDMSGQPSQHPTQNQPREFFPSDQERQNFSWALVSVQEKEKTFLCKNTSVIKIVNSKDNSVRYFRQ